jgi:hypothetical protein
MYSPEELLLLGDIFDLVVSTLPISMRTQHNRREVARNLLFQLAGGERDPIELELAAAGGLACSR